MNAYWMLIIVQALCQALQNCVYLFVWEREKGEQERSTVVTFPNASDSWGLDQAEGGNQELNPWLPLGQQEPGDLSLHHRLSPRVCITMARGQPLHSHVEPAYLLSTFMHTNSFNLYADIASSNSYKCMFYRFKINVQENLSTFPKIIDQESGEAKIPMVAEIQSPHFFPYANQSFFLNEINHRRPNEWQRQDLDRGQGEQGRVVCGWAGYGVQQSWISNSSLGHPLSAAIHFIRVGEYFKSYIASDNLLGSAWHI